MITVNLTQGSQDWLLWRKTKMTASDAAVVVGTSKYKTIDELAREKLTGEVKPISDFLQSIFASGHESEALYREHLELQLGFELYPVAAISDKYDWLACSFDGVSLDQSIIFEHKLFNQKLADYIIEHNDLPDTHWPQVEHQLEISGADYCIFATSDIANGIEGVQIEYKSMPERKKRVLQGWLDFIEYLNSGMVDKSAEQSENAEIDSKKFELIALTYLELKEQAKIITERLKVCEQDLKDFAAETGKEKIAGYGLTIARQVRKGAVDYSKIPELDGVDLDRYRKPDTEFFVIK